jgi:rhodanese-related sulfurtransferase/predicted small secreted protein
MRKKYFVYTFCVVAVSALLAGCNGKANTERSIGNSNDPPKLHGRLLERKPDTVARVTVAEAKEAIDAGEAVIVDVRPAADYHRQHIKGAINLPAPETGSRAKELPVNKLLITYCSCPAEQTAIGASQMYINNGYQNTAAMVGGTQGWIAAGYPVATGGQP